MKCYKLTDESFCTKNNTKWGKGVTHEIILPDASRDLCSEFWLHAYIDSRIAAIMNPIHANITNPVLWEAEAEGQIKHDEQLKFGCTRLTTIKQISLPEISIEKRVEFAIRCALKVFDNAQFKTWANKWLDGTDRTEAAARAAARAAAWAAAWAAEAAAWAARAARAEAAAWAAEAAAWAARAAEAREIDLLVILEECGI
jgi:hypothetical protein